MSTKNTPKNFSDEDRAALLRAAELYDRATERPFDELDGCVVQNTVDDMIATRLRILANGQPLDDDKFHRELGLLYGERTA